MCNEKPPISVSEMARQCRLSRQRFYFYLNAGLIPKPSKVGARPMYPPDLQEVVLKIRKTGVALDGSLILFNRPRHTSRKTKKSDSLRRDFAALFDSLSALGLKNVTVNQIESVLKDLYPQNQPDFESSEVIRAIFLRLQSRSSS